MSSLKVNDFSICDTASIGTGVIFRGTGKIGGNVKIGDYVIIDGEVEIGEGTEIGHHAVIAGKTFIGKENRVYPFCTIGTPPQHTGHDPEVQLGSVLIGDRNTLREYTTIHMPTMEGVTSIGNDCYLMVYCDINHDAVIEDYVKMASGCTVAGYVHIGPFTYLGMHATIHQHRHVGAYSMIGMNTPIMKHVLPYSTIIQQSFSKINRKGLELRGTPERYIKRIEDFYRALSRSADAQCLVVAAADDPVLKPIFDFWNHTDGKRYLPSLSDK